MSDFDSESARLHDVDEADAQAAYRSVSMQAVGSLVLGLLGFVALLHPLLWIVPIAGLMLGLAALRRIAARAPTLLGRKVAALGLMLSLFVCAAAPADYYAYRQLIRRESAQFADAWFMLLSKNHPHMAHQLTIVPTNRPPLDEQLWDRYYEGSGLRLSLEQFVNDELVRTLLALGEEGQVRHYVTEKIERVKGHDQVTQVYAVTHNDDGQETTFFVRLILERRILPTAGRADWYIQRRKGGITPKTTTES